MRLRPVVSRGRPAGGVLRGPRQAGAGVLVPDVRPTALEIWALLSGPAGFHRFEIGGGATLCDVRNHRRFSHLCSLGGRVGLVPLVENPAAKDRPPGHRRVVASHLPGPSNVLWVVASTPKTREAVEHFAPAPTVVVAEGATWTAVWALERSLSLGWTGALNKRLAHRLGTKLVDGGPWQTVGIPGSDLGRGRTVEAQGWTGEVHSARAVAGNLPDPVDHRAAWKARQAA
jgi:hypothetical protein